MRARKVKITVAGVEIEAPLDGSTPVEIYGSATIDGILIGPPNSKSADGKGCHYDTLIKVDSSVAQPWGLPGGWHGGPGGGNSPGVRASRGWAVNGLVVDNSSTRSSNTWDNIITVDGKGLDASWSNTSSLTVSQSMRFGDAMAAKDVPHANALYVDPASKKLTYRDGQGAAHPLY